MTLEDVLQILRDHRDELRDRGVETLAVFGSTARGESDSSSDVDLIVELSRPMGLFEFVRLQQHLETLLGSPVDLVTKSGLHPALRDRILGEAVRAA